jgi:hypothetical protein
VLQCVTHLCILLSVALPPPIHIGDIVNTEQLEEQIRKIVAQGMAGRVPAFHTAKRIMELVNDTLTELGEELAGK